MGTNFLETRYYCNRHWWSFQKRFDDWCMDLQEWQWGGTQWYNDLMINRICMTCHLPIRKDLKRLLKGKHCQCEQPVPMKGKP